MKFGKLKKGKTDTSPVTDEATEDLDAQTEPGSPEEKKASPFSKLLSFGGGSKDEEDEIAEGSFQEAPDDMRLSGYVLSFGKTETAISIVWVPADRDTKPSDIARLLSEQARSKDQSELDAATAPEQHFTLYADLRSRGFLAMSSPEAGHKPGMKSLITMISLRRTGRTWAGAFLINKSRDIWWVGAMRDGEVLEDAMKRSAHAARELLDEFLDLPDQNAIFAPDDWGIADSRPDPLHTIVNLKAGEALRNVSPLKANMPRIIVAGVVLAVAAGGFGFVYHMKKQEEQRLLELQRQIANRVVLRNSDKPWFHSTAIADVVSACAKNIQKGVVMIPGWETQPISCTIGRDGKGIIVTGWTNKGGKSSWLRAALPPDLPQPNFDQLARSADWNMPFTAPYDEESQNQMPWSEDKIFSWLSERFQNADVPIDLRASTDNRPTAQKKPQFNSVELRISSEVGLKNYVDMLSDVPALVPTAVIYNPAKGHWDLVAKVYEPVIMPKAK